MEAAMRPIFHYRGRGFRRYRRGFWGFRRPMRFGGRLFGLAGLAALAYSLIDNNRRRNAAWQGQAYDASSYYPDQEPRPVNHGSEGDVF